MSCSGFRRASVASDHCRTFAGDYCRPDILPEQAGPAVEGSCSAFIHWLALSPAMARPLSEARGGFKPRARIAYRIGGRPHQIGFLVDGVFEDVD